MDVIHTEFAPVTELNRGKAMNVIQRVKDKNCATYIMRNNYPEAVMISVDLFNEIQEMLFYKSVAERVEYNKAHSGQKNITADEVKSKYGITDEELSTIPDVEIDFD